MIQTESGGEHSTEKSGWQLRHEQVSSDPLTELIRRRQSWASAPGERGAVLRPSACIVPLSTVNAAVADLCLMRAALEQIERHFNAYKNISDIESANEVISEMVAIARYALLKSGDRTDDTKSEVSE